MGRGWEDTSVTSFPHPTAVYESYLCNLHPLPHGIMPMSVVHGYLSYIVNHATPRSPLPTVVYGS